MESAALVISSFNRFVGKQRKMLRSGTASRALKPSYLLFKSYSGLVSPKFRVFFFINAMAGRKLYIVTESSFTEPVSLTIQFNSTYPSCAPSAEKEKNLISGLGGVL